MKKIKYYALGLLSVALLTAGLYACSNEDAINMKKDESGRNLTTKSNDIFEGGKIATIVNGNAVPLYDEIEVKEGLVDDGLYIEVDSVEITYGLNTESKKYEAFITIIGKQAASSLVSATVGDLIIDGNNLNVPGENNLTTFATHTCAGQNCLSCEFERTGFFKRIVGCKACSKPSIEDKPASCNHSQTSDGSFIGSVVRAIAQFAS